MFSLHFRPVLAIEEPIAIKSKNKQKKKPNPKEWRETDLQDYHISGFKYPVFNKLATRHTEKQESMAHSEGKKK
jgi:hypothetical protein